MAFIQKKERILIDRLLNADNIRKSIKYNHYLRERSKVNVRESLEQAGERIFRLEKSLRDIWSIREKRKRLKDMFEANTKLEHSMKMREEVKKSAFVQQQKLSGTYLKKNLYTNESLSPTGALPSLSSLAPSNSHSPVKKKKTFNSIKLLKHQ